MSFNNNNNNNNNNNDDDDDDYLPSSGDDESSSDYVSKSHKRKYYFRKTTLANKNLKNNDICITISEVNKVKRVKKPFVRVIHNDDLEPIPFKIESFKDFYKLAKLCVEDQILFKDCQLLPDIWPILQDLNNMIGLKSVKDGITKMIIYELQSDIFKTNEKYYRHIVLTGAPGTGKTTIANIIARLLNKLGKTNSDKITIGNRRNMISDFQGQTKTCVDTIVKEALSESGILFIDEAPNLNDGRNKDNPDTYSKSCLDTLMECMDEYKDKLIVILSGYKDEMDTNVLTNNKGMKRRIQYYFNIEPYEADELYLIFNKQLLATNYELPKNNNVITIDWFKKHIKFFPYSGGSVRNFVEKIRTIHVNETFGQTNKTILLLSTLSKGFEHYKNTNLDKNFLVNNKSKLPPFGIYV
jgi:Cdc6-like AAA superfamily ATPase